jgi:hypothetical protein
MTTKKVGPVWRLAVALVLLGIVGGASLLADDAKTATKVYTKDNAPKAPELSALPLKDSVTQYGITWTFDKKVPVGQFVNGDYYVVGAVTVTAIDPKPQFGEDVPASELGKGENPAKALRNGSTLNQPPEHAVGLDSGTKNFFKPQLAAHLPIKMNPTDSLVSSISLKQEDPKVVFPYPHCGYKRNEGDASPTKVVAVLSCVAGPLAPDAFRPGYGDRQGKIYYAHDLKRDQLPSLPRVKGAPTPTTLVPVFQKPWFNPCFFGFETPQEDMPSYGQQIGQAVSDASMVLCFDYTPEEKEPLLINLVQVGLDYWSLVKSGHPGWQGWGGHDSGHKFPIVFAGFMLGDAEMASPTKAFPKVELGEDNQTRYGKGWTGATVVFAGHSGISSATDKAPRPQWGPYEHMDPSKWDDENYRSEAYRRANTSCCWVGEALAMRLMKMEKVWDHDAFFDYVDRWMTEDDKPFAEEIAKSFPKDKVALTDPSKGWYHEGNAGWPWLSDAWTKYRGNSAAPTDGWKKEHKSDIPEDLLKVKEKKAEK